MENSINVQPQVSFLGDEMVITVPRWMWEQMQSFTIRPAEDTPHQAEDEKFASDKLR